MRPIKRQMMDDRFFLRHARAYRKPIFRGGVHSVPLTAHLEALEFELPKLAKHGRQGFKVDTLVGELEAAIHVYALGSPGSPVLIYHHDAGEHPVTETLRAMFPANSDTGLTIFMIEAPFHDSRSEAQIATASVEIYLAMQAVAIATTEHLLLSVRPEASLRFVAGYGQGGFICNRHHMIFDTASAYIPFMAGAAEAEAFLARPQRDKGVDRNRDAFRRLLNFDDAWAERGHRNVYPVLGSIDLINPFQAEMSSYGKTPIEVWATSHLTALKSPLRLREKILRTIASLERDRIGVREAAPAKLRAFGS